MPREKEGYREILMFISEKYGMTLQKKEACEALGVSLPHLNKMIKQGEIKFTYGKIPIGSIVSYLCG